MKLVLQWEGQLVEASDKTYKGEVKIDEFSSHNDPDEYLFDVTADGKGAAQDKCKEIVKGMKAALLERLAEFVRRLDASY